MRVCVLFQHVLMKFERRNNNININNNEAFVFSGSKKEFQWKMYERKLHFRFAEANSRLLIYSVPMTHSQNNIMNNVTFDPLLLFGAIWTLLRYNLKWHLRLLPNETQYEMSKSLFDLCQVLFSIPWNMTHNENLTVDLMRWKPIIKTYQLKNVESENSQKRYLFHKLDFCSYNNTRNKHLKFVALHDWEINNNFSLDRIYSIPLNYYLHICWLDCYYFCLVDFVWEQSFGK